MRREFFANSEEEWRAFVRHISGKRCLDIGPCVMSPLAVWYVASERFAIEPLFEKIDAWQRTHLGASAYDGITCFAAPAEKLVPQLVATIDGAILCRNMLDHTPQWPFVLSNIAQYAAPGCALLLWTDLDHRGEQDVGHYDLTPDAGAFKRLVS